MRTRSRRLFALSLAILPAIVACTSDDDETLTPEDSGNAGCFSSNGVVLCRDSAVNLPDTGGRVDASCITATGISSCIDATAPDVNEPDVNVADTTVADTNAPDTNQPDTNQPDAHDASVADVNVPDTNAPDTSTPHDAGPDVFDAGVDTGPDAGCVVDVFGDYYVRTDGTVFSMLTTPYSQVLDDTASPLGPVSEVMQQNDHACALRSSDGTVWCWPHVLNSGNTNGDLGNGHFNGNQLAYVATKVVTQPNDAGPEKYLTGVTSISTRSHAFYSEPTCAIKSDRTLWCWGYMTVLGSAANVEYATQVPLAPGDGGPPTSFVKADQIVLGDRHACYLDTGAVHCWGNNIAGNLGTGDTTYEPYPIAVQTGFGLPATVEQISAEYDVTCAMAGGKVWCWGADNSYQTGNVSVPRQICNSNYCEPVPAPVQEVGPDGGTSTTALANITQLTGGYLGLCGLDTSGSLWCWGENNAGVSNVSEATPYKPASGTPPYTNVKAVSLWGEDFGTGLRYLTTDGTLVRGTQVVTPVCSP